VLRGCGAPVQVVEEARQPPHHHLVVVPALQQLPEQELVAVIPQRGQHLGATQLVSGAEHGRSARCAQQELCTAGRTFSSMYWLKACLYRSYSASE